ncbi:MAG: cyclin-dependent kinase inhibitor 3 family protein [Limnospira sp.]
MNSIRTSENDPITVDFLPSEWVAWPGRIGMTFAPGKQHRGMHFCWSRNLQKDLDRLRGEYQTDILISLIEAPELERVHIPNLMPEVRARGMESWWFPIPDLKVPTSMEGLLDLVEKILGAVRDSYTVVIHCMGGLGRTGVVASCCLVALGCEPEAAIAEVRRVRQYTVETPEQENYVVQFSRVWVKRHTLIPFGDRLSQQRYG